MCFPLKIRNLGSFLHFLWFPVLFFSKVLSAQKHHFEWFPTLVVVPSVVWLLSAFCSKWTFWVVPFIFYGSQCCLVQIYFPFKINIFGWFLSLYIVPSVVWLQCVFCSKPIFFHFSWFFVLFHSQCCLAPICFPLKINILGGSPHFLWFQVLFGSKLLSAHLVELLEVVWTILELKQEFWIIWSVYFSYTYSSQILRHNNANIGWLLSGETWKYWIHYMYEKYRTPLRVVRYFSYMQLIQYFQVSPSSHPILYQTWYVGSGGYKYYPHGLS